MAENKTSQNVTTPTPPPAMVIKKSGFSWGTFLAGCFCGCLLPILALGLLTTVGAAVAPQIISRATSTLLPKVAPQTNATPAALPVSAENCGTDMACLGRAIQNCTPAKSEISNSEFGLSLQVLGPSTQIAGNCRVSFAVSKISDPKLQLLGLEGQNMTCDVKPAVFSSPQEILSAPDSDLNCEGSLWGLLKIVRAGQSQPK